MYIRRPTTLQMVWSNFLAPFSATLWLAIGVLVLFLGAMLTWACDVTRRHAQQDGDGEVTFSLVDSWLCILGLLTQQGSCIHNMNLS